MKSNPDELPSPSANAYGLTRREMTVVMLVARGMTRKEIADSLNLSVNTVGRHLTNAYRKLGVKNGAEAVAKLFQRIEIWHPSVISC